MEDDTRVDDDALSDALLLIMVDDAPMTRADVVKERRHRVYRMLPVDDALIVLMTCC